MQIDRSIFAEVARLKLATPGVAAGRQAGDRRSPFLGRGVEFADYRPYGPGDDLRLVDWNVYARLEMVLVRLFHEDRNLQVQICIDASASMKYGKPRKLDYAGQLAAALALLGMLTRDNVILSCAGGTGPRTVVKGQNENEFGKVLQYLELVEPSGVEDPVRGLRASTHGTKPDRLFYISDMLKEEAELDRLLRLISSTARKPVLLHVLSNEELAPDLRHPQRVVDEETGEEIRVIGGRAAEKGYQEALSAYLADVEQRCRALRIQYLQAFTQVDLRTLLNTVMRRMRVVESASGASR